MPMRSSTLQAGTSVAVSREIGSQYDNVKLVAESIDDVNLIADNIAIIQDSAAVLGELVDNINANVTAAEASAQAASNSEDASAQSAIEAEAARDAILNMQVATGAPATSVTWDGTTLTVPRGATGIQGPQGIQGIQGLQGEQGVAGPVGPMGPMGYSITAKGVNTEANILALSGLVQGDFWVASDTGNGFVYDGTALVNIGYLRGVQGLQGDQGPQGVQGIQGTSIVSIVRTNGTGAAGTTDTYTVTMSDASTGTFTVYNGSNGADGNGIASVTRTNGTGQAGTTDTYTITFTDSTTTTFDVYNGANGTNGINGADGTDGRSIVSVVRTSGTGQAGEIDTYTITYSDATTSGFNVRNGNDGTNGTNGVDGRGIVSTVRTSGTGLAGTTDTYTITYTDATTSTFTVYNGTDGTGSGDMSKSVYDTNNDGKVDSAEVADNVPWTGVTGKPSTFPPDVHNHDTLYEPINTNIQAHIASTSNPHSVTKVQVGLGNVDNTADNVKAVLSASKLTTARNVSMSGDVTGTASFDGSADIDIVVTVTDDSHTHDGRYYTEAEIDNMLAGLDPLPTQTGQTGKYLTTNGTDASWAEVQSGSEHYDQEATPTSPTVGATWYKPSTGKIYTRINDGTADVWIDTGASSSGVTQDYVEQAIDAIDALPLQTGNSGKFLTTDGTIASWGTVVSDHGGLTGLSDDDHPQYHNDARGDARYLKLSGGTVTALKETSVAMPANNIDLSLGNLFTKTVSGATTLTVSNAPTSGTVGYFILQLTNGGSATVTWFSGVKWAGGTAPTLTASGKDILSFYTIDGGTTWNCVSIQKDVK